MDSNQNPESLQDLGKGRDKMVGDAFVNPGFPSSPLATSADRKTGVVNESANVKLREAMAQPGGNGVQS